MDDERLYTDCEVRIIFFIFFLFKSFHHEGKQYIHNVSTTVSYDVPQDFKFFTISKSFSSCLSVLLGCFSVFTVCW